ncbi:FAD-binding oxidoreductase [Flavobacterium sp. LS1R47]|uniref:FAD-binding oxidoreductase n=1 Tax=Flavobacterium frigoritolerans TaxID=2987686 RepID=A0A9X2ZSK3_9FLAO|nr:FAD-binding oxidoreductase [Flavobacterium frigoritolerans]MCV9933608.1 FAD-binding oxidoreductase [Flavobacterium frigoritolerans]
MKNTLITVIDKKAPGYQDARKISNLLLLNNNKLSPDKIAYCETSDDVIYVLNYCQQNKKSFRIRSGGHHHEGACTGDNVIVVDISRMDKMVINKATSTIIIPSGAKLENVYAKLNEQELLIPGGGCDSVTIGGLAQGGGWGPYSRLYGMTCDSLVSAQIIIADDESGFKKVEINATNDYKDLFNALKGSGGGNFGVVTSFTFKTQSLIGLKKESFDIKISNGREPEKRLEQWFKNASKAINPITSFVRVYPDTDELKDPIRLYISGIIVVKKNDTDQAIKKQIATIIDKDFPTKDINLIRNTPSSNDKNNKKKLSSLENSFSSHLAIYDAIKVQKDTPAIAAPTSTCDAPHPHKISSFFPKKGIDYASLATAIFEYMNKNKSFGSKANTYLSLHGMGGKIKDGDNFFYYKDRDFMFQIQAWWSNPTDPDNDKYLTWVENLRLDLSKKGFTEGCFVNFPDYNCIRKSPKSEKYNAENDGERIELLIQFYGKRYLGDLLQVKQKYDRNNSFLHEMSLKSGLKGNFFSSELKLQNNGWIGGFEESNPEFKYPKPNLTSLPILDNMANIDKLQRQMKAEWPEFSWITILGVQKSRCFQMFATNISRIGYTAEGRVYSIICPQQGAYLKSVGINLNVEVTVTGQRGWVNEDSREMAADLGVVGKIWFSPDNNANPFIKFLLNELDKTKFPFSKATAIQVNTSRVGDAKGIYFPLLRGETDRFKSPDFAKHENVAFTVANLDVQINDITLTKDPIVDKFNTIILGIFNILSANMLKKTNVLSWNIWFNKPSVVDQEEWRKHAEYWRHSLDVNHCSPDGDGTDAKYFDGKPLQISKLEILIELYKLYKEVIKPNYVALGIKNVSKLNEIAEPLNQEIKAIKAIQKQ